MTLHDQDIREPLFDYLEETHGQMRILEELTMGKSRADIVMVTPDALYGIEIKSDADTYVRLKSQVKDYDKVYDYNLVVVGTRHAMHIEEHVPAHWGILTVEIVDNAFDFYMLRQPKKNPKASLKNQLKLLWRMELAWIQEENHMAKYKEKSRDFVIEKILEKVSTDDVPKNKSIPATLLSSQICHLLLERDYSTVQFPFKSKRRRRRR